MDFTTKEIIIILIGSGGIIGGLVAALNFISGRIDAYRKRRQEAGQEVAGDRNRYVDDLWKMIETERKENAELRVELKELEDGDKFSRPKISKIFRLIRAMRHELDQINVMVFDQESTNLFMKRWNAVKQGCDDLEDLLASPDDSHVTVEPSV